MSRYQLIAFDMDGTLLDSGKNISPDSLEAIRRADEAGKLVALSTGRCPAELAAYMEQLSALRYVIGVSGALVYDCRTGEKLFAQYLSGEEVATILAAAEGEDVMPQALGDVGYIQRDHFDHIEEYGMGVYRPSFEKNMILKGEVRRFIREEKPKLHKINFYCRTPEQREIIERRLAGSGLQLVHSEITGLECSPGGITKGLGLEKLCGAIGLPAEQTIAVGDANNDLDILARAGLSVAMGNANAQVLAAADVVVADNDHGGCAEAIDRYLMAD